MHFYPRPPRGGRLHGRSVVQCGQSISIHALREEGDVRTQVQACRAVQISIHALREEGDAFLNPLPQRRKEFLSTPSARRATPVDSVTLTEVIDFYPRPPRGGRPACFASHNVFLLFLSTPSARRATSKSGEQCQTEKYFYPRPPRGGRPNAQRRTKNLGYFYPRPPRGGRPGGAAAADGKDGISIHALREEGDGQRNRT